MKKSIWAAVLILSTSSASVSAKVTLPTIIADHMVMQRNDTMKIYGSADANENVQVMFSKKKYKTQADAQGHWQVLIPTGKARGPLSMQVNDITLQDIYVGDVWLTSGQSNMDLMINRVTDLYAAETDVYENPKIHLIQLTTRSTPQGEQSDLSRHDRWEPLTPQNSQHWSALSYFFAQEMYEKTGIAQGIINASQGGTPIEAWIGRPYLEQAFPQYIKEVDYALTDGYMERCQRLSNTVSKEWSTLLDNGDPGLIGQWTDPKLDDSDWQTINMFDTNIGDINGRPFTGTLWFRKEFDVPADMCNQEGMLRLGCMVDADEAFINGQRVGVTSYQYPPRRYAFKSNILRPGRNVLTIRLKTYGDRTKFVKEKPYKIIVGNKEISLEGNLKMKRGALMPHSPNVPSFGNIATGLYNGMIAPIKDYAIGGIIWYQGESNTGKHREYKRMLETLADNWRADFGQDVPLIIVQIANFMQRHNYPVESNQAALREAQRRGAYEIANAGLVSAIDLGEWNDIHPLHKKELAQRVALQAERLYLKKNIVAEGPIYQSCRVENGKMILQFDPQGATIAPCDDLSGFAIAGNDHKYVNAQAQIDGQTIIVWSPSISEPKSVRYGWDDDPIVSVYGTNGLPASPFTTEK